MYSKKNANFSTFYSMVHSFAMVTERADRVRDLVDEDKQVLASARHLLEHNVLELQRKIKTKQKLKR